MRKWPGLTKRFSKEMQKGRGKEAREADRETSFLFLYRSENLSETVRKPVKRFDSWGSSRNPVLW